MRRRAPFPDLGAAGYALAAYGLWGVTPVYWKGLAQVPALEILAHRVVWTVALTSGLLFLARRWSEVAAALRSRRQLAALVCSSALIGSNWLVFIWAVNHEQLLATSLGYYLNPLVNVVLGVVLLNERLRRAQVLAVAIAAVGVVVLAVEAGGVPGVSLYLAGSFALYGLLRKQAPARPMVSLGIETALMAPAAALWLGTLSWRGQGHFGAEPFTTALLAGAGLATALPLLAFAAAAPRLPLSTLGLFQYLAPSIGFVLAVGVYGEPFGRGQAVAFACIWLALALFTSDSLRKARAGRSAPAARALERP